MNLGIFLSPGENISLMKKAGQDVRFINLYLKKYSKNFVNVYVFSYANEQRKIANNIYIIPNNSNLHRILYSILLPLIKKKEIDKCDVIRGFGLSSALSSIFLLKPFIFNWAYDYAELVKIERKSLYIPFYFFLEKLAFIKASKVLIATKKKLKTLKNNKFVYLPNGVDLDLFKNLKTNQSGVIYVGRFEKQKNLFFLLDAISLLQKPQITLVGVGSQKLALQKYAKRKRVLLKIVSPVSNSKLPNLLSKYSIFALPSLSEGSPKVLLEAMAMGLVPIVTSFKTAGEIITDGKNGFVVNYNAKEFAKKIADVLNNNNLRKKLSVNAKNTIIENFDQQKLIKKEISMLKNA